jgi:hypothetical protein
VVGLGQRLAVGQRRLDACINPVAAGRRLAVKAELARGAHDLTLETHLGEAGLLHGARHQLGRPGFQLLRDGSEKLAARRAGQLRPDRGSLDGQLHSALHILRGGRQEGRLDGDILRGIEGLERRAARAAGPKTDE